MSQSKRTFSCCLIGGDTLLTQCGELLLNAGHSLTRVITDAPQVAAWARGHNVEVLAVSSDYATALQQLSYDYLFAITHLAIIPEAAVASPARGAINFHDGPLPEYAGLNTPMWALLNGRPEYAISWHVMAAGIDTGDVLIRHPVGISEDDTAVSLNTKCFTAALESFPVLLNQLETESLQPEAQDLSAREYFGRADKPEGFSLLDWQLPALDLERQVRALNTGRYENTLGCAKLVVGDSVYVVENARVCEDAPTTEPGTVIALDDSTLRVACGAAALDILRLDDLSGNEVPLADLALAPGDTLPLPAVDADLNAGVAKAEAFWTRRLLATEAVTLPYRSGSVKTAPGDALARRDVAVPDSLRHAASRTAAVFVAFLSRVAGADEVSLAFSGGTLTERALAHPSVLADFGVDQFVFDQAGDLEQQLTALAAQLEKNLQREPWLRDLSFRQPRLRANPALNGDVPLSAGVAFDDGAAPAELTLRFDDTNVAIEYIPNAFDEEAIASLCAHFESLLRGVAGGEASRACELDLLEEAERQRLLVTLNDTSVEHDRSLLMHGRFEQLAAEQPDEVAVVAGGQTITYGELDRRAEALAGELAAMGAGPDVLVGVYVTRSIELMVATLAVLKAGAAYVPLDPAFPGDRIAFMIQDSAMPIVVTQRSLQASLPDCEAAQLVLDDFDFSATVERSSCSAEPGNLAYVIYTSGSTGLPKGVMLEHRNVVNFFVAMDAAVPGAAQDQRTWLAVTSLSFDISVLELFWTVNRGFKVVIHDEAASRASDQTAAPDRVLDMGLFMWGNDDAPGPDKYRLLTEGAKFFDENGFSAVWTPERHFHAFGGPYPNPAVTGAAVAAITEHVKIRAGSCVVPLHHPVRIAEEWGVVDNLSNGRVEIAAASGWNPNDFVLKPENHADNKRVMYDQLEQVRRLWRGEKLAFPGPLGEVEVESLPRPVQPELPCWITTAGNPDTWIEAGKLGHNVLTHLLGQSVEEVGEKIRLYRQARAEAGHDPDAGRVALMLHTFVGTDNAEVKELVREPMKDYLSSSMRLAMDYAWAFPAFKKPGGDTAKPEDVDLKSLSDEEVDTILEFAFERYFETSGLFGDEDTCLQMLGRCTSMGVDEIACLLDFGVPTQMVMDSLPRLKALRDRMVSTVSAEGTSEVYNLADLVREHNVTHLQCTPSTARMYLTDADTRDAYLSVPNLLLGGEALPPALAGEIKDGHDGTLTNMYGPTETTIWSMTSSVDSVEDGISIGAPIANTRIYVLDKHRQPLPAGIPGELFIGGEGVARGYHNRDELTAERFVADPFAGSADARMYATGDLATYRADGTLDFLGRTDFQVKVRGYRIELGEIESRLENVDTILEAAVIVRAADAGDQRMVAFVTPTAGADLDHARLRQNLRETLPEYMVPNEFVNLEYMPRTANGKLDRKALAEIKPVVARQVEADAAPSSDLEKQIAELWRNVLKLDAVGLNENFFDLGGHSLLVVQLHGQLKETIDQPISLTDLYQYTTIRALCDFLKDGADDSGVQQSLSRGQQRRALRRRRAS